MDTTNIIMTDEVIETAEDAANAGLEKVIKIGVGIGVAALVSVIVYKRVVKPILAKIKTKREQRAVDENDFDRFGEDEESTEN